MNDTSAIIFDSDSITLQTDSSNSTYLYACINGNAILIGNMIKFGQTDISCWWWC